MMRKLLCIVLLLPFVVAAQDETRIQQAENLIFEGNEAFDALNSVEAEKKYRRALATGIKTDIARYNMGTTLQQDNYVDEALRAYADVAKTTKGRPNKHRTFHNIGNALMQAKDYKGAVEAYKNALRNNPADDETRYNYALAKKMLEDENQNQDNQDQQDNQENQENQDQQNDQNQDQRGDNEKEQEGENQQDNKDQSGDEGENEKDENEKDEKESDKNDRQDQEGKNEKEQQQPQAQPAQLSPQQVQNLLEAMNNEEKKVQDKVNAKKAKSVGTKNKKDW
jgi:Ca-activated chloride channel family protein